MVAESVWCVIVNRSVSELYFYFKAEDLGVVGLVIWGAGVGRVGGSWRKERGGEAFAF